MSIEPLDPLPDDRLAPTASALGGPLRATLDRLHGLGFRSVQLDVLAGGARPSELDRSGRRDLLAALRRRELTLAGLDAWVPEEAWADPARQDALVEGLLATIRLAADLGRVPISVSWPGPSRETAAPAGRPDAPTGPGGLIVPPGILAAPEPSGSAARAAAESSDTTAADASPADDLVAAVLEGAILEGVPCVDHHLPPRASPIDAAAVRMGVDTAACLAQGLDVVTTIAVAGERLASLRFVDLDAAGMRGAPGRPGGRLDVAAVRGALSLLGPIPVVVDARQWVDPWRGLAIASSAWHAAEVGR